MENVSAAAQLVARNRRIREQYGDDAEDAGSLVIAGLEQVGNRELGEFSGAWCDEVNEQQASPSSGRLPQSGKSITIGIFCTRKQGTCANPGREQRENQHEGG